MGKTATVEFEQGMASAYFFCIFLSKFRHRDYFSPIVLFVDDKKLEVNLIDAILSLYLAIGLDVEKSRKSSFNS